MWHAVARLTGVAMAVLAILAVLTLRHARKRPAPHTAPPLAMVTPPPVVATPAPELAPEVVPEVAREVVPERAITPPPARKPAHKHTLKRVRVAAHAKRAVRGRVPPL
jgi:hypothetical protein